MKLTLDISPESTAYVFDNAFANRWFRAIRIREDSSAPTSRAPGFWRHNHSEPARWVALGGTVEIEALDPADEMFRWYTVQLADFERAYSLYVSGNRSATNLLDGSADVDACDAWLQYSVFGKLVYG